MSKDIKKDEVVITESIKPTETAKPASLAAYLSDKTRTEIARIESLCATYSATAPTADQVDKLRTDVATLNASIDTDIINNVISANAGDAHGAITYAILHCYHSTHCSLRTPTDKKAGYGLKTFKKLSTFPFLDLLKALKYDMEVDTVKNLCFYFLSKAEKDLAITTKTAAPKTYEEWLNKYKDSTGKLSNTSITRILNDVLNTICFTPSRTDKRDKSGKIMNAHFTTSRDANFLYAASTSKLRNCGTIRVNGVEAMTVLVLEVFHHAITGKEYKVITTK